MERSMEQMIESLGNALRALDRGDAGVADRLVRRVRSDLQLAIEEARPASVLEGRCDCESACCFGDDDLDDLDDFGPF